MRPDSLAFLHRLHDAPGPSGFETAPARVWRTEAESIADEVHADVSGNSRAVLHPPGTPRVMFAGHIDEIGLMVSHVDDDGFLSFLAIGGWDPQVLVGQRGVVASRDAPVTGGLSIFRKSNASPFLRFIPIYESIHIPGAAAEAASGEFQSRGAVSRRNSPTSIPQCASASSLFEAF